MYVESEGFSTRIVCWQCSSWSSVLSSFVSSVQIFERGVLTHSCLVLNVSAFIFTVTVGLGLQHYLQFFKFYDNFCPSVISCWSLFLLTFRDGGRKCRFLQRTFIILRSGLLSYPLSRYDGIMSTEVRFLSYTVGLYACFIYWGYLQEKLTSTKYKSVTTGEEFDWDYAFALNFFMALGGFIVASGVEIIVNSNDGSTKARKIPFIEFATAAISSTLASPIGYAALKYISFPLVILAKSSKPVPVIFIGTIFYGRTYTWYKMAGVVLLCGGIALFSSAKGGSVKSSSATAALSNGNETTNLLTGIFLVAMNLLLDGYTNNEQDRIFESLHATSLQMMKNVNLWTTFYISSYLFLGYLVQRGNSEIAGAYKSFSNSQELRFDILLFCICAAVGQVLIFAVMKEFGSLTWITISITRKLFTILFSVFMFNHPVKSIQWLGIALVFLGMTLEVVMSYISKSKKLSNTEVDKIKKV